MHLLWLSISALIRCSSVDQLPDPVWLQIIISFVNRRSADSPLPRIDRRTYSIFERHLVAIKALESCVFEIRRCASANEPISEAIFTPIANLSKQLRFEHLVTDRKQRLINDILSESEHRRLTTTECHMLNAMGHRAMTLRECDALLYDEMSDINLPYRIKQKLKLLILSSRATHLRHTAIFEHGEDGTQTHQVSNEAGYPLVIVTHFPSIACPTEGVANWGGAHLLCFSFLFEWLWDSFYEQMFLPRLEALPHITPFDTADTQRLRFVQFLMDQRGLCVGDKASLAVWRREVFNETRFTPEHDECEFLWLVMEADRICDALSYGDNSFLLSCLLWLIVSCAFDWLNDHHLLRHLRPYRLFQSGHVRPCLLPAALSVCWSKCALSSQRRNSSPWWTSHQPCLFGITGAIARPQLHVNQMQIRSSTSCTWSSLLKTCRR